MSAFGSSSRSNGTKKEEPQQESNFVRNLTTVVGTLGAGAALFWGASRLLSDNNTDNEQKNRNMMEPSVVNHHYLILEGSQRSVWSPPHRGRYKMNTDGGCHPVRHVSSDGVQGGPSGYGGILRDYKGNWVRGFIGFIGEADSFTAELYGIVKGLELLDKYDFKGAILEADHETACGFVNGEGEYHGKSEIVVEAWPIIKRCRYLRIKNRITVNHILGKPANKCADKLADIAIETKLEYMEIKALPDELKNLVETDARFYG